MSDEGKLDRLLQDFDAKESARQSSFRNTAIGVLLFAIALSGAALWTSFQLVQAEKQKTQVLGASLKAKLAESHRLRVLRLQRGVPMTKPSPSMIKRLNLIHLMESPTS